MYLVKIINDGVETIINHVSTSNKANRISGTIKKGINCIDSFTFNIFHNNEGYNLIKPLKTLINVYNTKTNKYEFRGRVLKLVGEMSSSGVISKNFVCESELAYLIDSNQLYGKYHNITPKGYLKLILDNHNSKVEEFKRFELGEVTVTNTTDNLYKYLAYDTTWKNINDDLLDTLGGELQIRYEGNIRYLDYLTEIGTTCTTALRLGKNIKDISNEKDPTTYYTRLIPLGTKLSITDEEGNEVDTEERLTISSVNAGINYLDDIDAIEEFGIIEGIVTWDDVTTPAALLTKGKNYLKSQKISITNKINALDLSLIGLDIDSFEVGNYYPLKHELLDIDYNVRIIEKTIDISSPESSSITLGDKQIDIKDYQLEMEKQTNKINSISKDITSTKLEIKNVSALANTTAKSVNKVSEEVINLGNNTSGTIAAMVESITLLSETVQAISEDLTNINSTILQVNENIVEMNKTIKENSDRITALEEVVNG